MPAMCGLTTIPLAPVRLQNQRRSEASRGLRRGLLFENRIAKRANLNCAFFFRVPGQQEWCRHFYFRFFRAGDTVFALNRRTSVEFQGKRIAGLRSVQTLGDRLVVRPRD